jgi:hypothetical protein
MVRPAKPPVLASTGRLRRSTSPVTGAPTWSGRISPPCSRFLFFSRHAASPFTAPCTTHNREVRPSRTHPPFRAWSPFGPRTPVNRRELSAHAPGRARARTRLFAGSLWPRPPQVLLAMQKVEGSNPISRPMNPATAGFCSEAASRAVTGSATSAALLPSAWTVSSGCQRRRCGVAAGASRRARPEPPRRRRSLDAVCRDLDQWARDDRRAG